MVCSNAISKWHYPSKKNGSVSYSLDPVGNRLSQTSSLHNVPTVGFSYSADDTLLGETYDGNGNVTATGGKTFSYDSQNELISANGGAVTVMYDGFGNRVSKTASGVTTKYLVDDLNPTGYTQVFDELTGSTVTRTYTYGLQRISENQVVDSVWTPSFYGYDGFGTVRQLTNTAGAVTDTFEYDAFGNAITHTGTTPNNYLYRGEQYDTDLGLYYLRVRYYTPQTGRFMSRDPEDGYIGLPATLHKYFYAGGDPVNHIDPRGRLFTEYINESNAAIPEARLIDIYGCVADATLAGIDLIIDKIEPNDTTGNISTAAGGASAVVGCVLLTPALTELADAGNKIVKSAQFLGEAAGWGSCALNAEDLIKVLNDLTTGKAAGEDIGKTVETLGGCVQDALGYLIKNPGKLLSLGIH
jgi:RHS repeat-associated protein